MDKETFLSIIGLLGALTTIIKLLIDGYFKKASELEAHKASFIDSQILELKKIVNHISETVEQFKREIVSQSEKTRSLHQSLNGFISVVKAYVEVNTKKTDEMKSDIVKISKDIFMIKGKK